MLHEQDEKCIESSVEYSSTSSEGTPQLLTRVLETSDDDNDEGEESLSDRCCDPSCPRPATTNGHSCDRT